MRRIYGVCVVLLTLVFLAVPGEAQAQGAGGQGRSGGLGQNYPNPFNPATNIPFDLVPENFVDGKAEVTIRIMNVLMQLVAVPTALNHPAGNGAKVERLEYTTPGHYVAYWDGLDKDGRKVGSQVLIVLFEVNGRRVGEPVRMTVSK